jgi:SpoVK/Ycf46/Vps4 family AAA+-type ATPase
LIQNSEIRVFLFLFFIGKSELLKLAAVFAGITMTTSPLAAGELNRPYVGETEKLLIDIMYRAHTIPYLICAMTIDEIDGLVPKRDNNAQQSKVDGISVLLSHIEGVKNIPNLIVFGATNRRNMMDEAFLRRMQGKCFVGRPSPKIRKKMLRPLLSKNSNLFTNERLDFLVKVTTNFSGAAISALRSSIIIAIDETDQTSLTNTTLLELADNAAREFSCWFGIGTLPEIGRMYPNLFNSENNHQHEQYSLSLPKMIPSGRILVDLRDRKCLIELLNEPTLEKTLDDGETSMLTLIARFVHGCSTRNIDTIQIIDMNFLTKNNAFDENQIFELLTTTFLGRSHSENNFLH